MKFIKAQIDDRLKSLDQHKRAIFAICCATRLQSAYSHLHKKHSQGNPPLLREAINMIWSWASGNDIPRAVFESYLDKVMLLVPEEDDNWTIDSAYAEDAVSAVAYSIRSILNDDYKEACWASTCMWDAVDSYITNTLNVDWALADAETVISENVLMQSEFARQKRDLDDLESLSGSFEELCTNFKTRAEAEQALPLQS
jgi:uncharacterized protein YjaG (DUF416 family)